MLNNKKIVFTTGGTGGHINPALAVAGEIRRKYPEAKILFICEYTSISVLISYNPQSYGPSLY